MATRLPGPQPALAPASRCGGPARRAPSAETPSGGYLGAAAGQTGPSRPAGHSPRGHRARCPSASSTGSCPRLSHSQRLGSDGSSGTDCSLLAWPELRAGGRSPQPPRGPAISAQNPTRGRLARPLWFLRAETCGFNFLQKQGRTKPLGKLMPTAHVQVPAVCLWVLGGGGCARPVLLHLTGSPTRPPEGRASSQEAAFLYFIQI